MSLDILIRLLQFALDSGNALLVVVGLLCLPLSELMWRAPDTAMRYFFASTLTLLPEEKRKRFQDAFRSLEAGTGKEKRDDSDEASQ